MTETQETDQLSDRLRALENDEPPVVCDSFTGAVSTPPIAAEINAAFGATAAQLRDGWTGVIDDTVNGNTWICVSENDNWRVIGTIGGGGGVHNILSATHGDSVANAVTRGSLIYGNSTPQWDELIIGGITGSVLTRNATDALWSGFGLSGTAGQTYTFPGASASIPGGSGVANQITYWSGANALAGRASFTDDGTTVYINRNSATALKVEQSGVNNNVLVVDTGNGYVGVGTATPGVRFGVDNGTVVGTMAEFVSAPTTGSRKANISVIQNASANTNNAAGFTLWCRTTSGQRSSFEYTASFSDTTDATRTSLVLLNAAVSGTFTSVAAFAGDRFGIGLGLTSMLGKAHIDQSSLTGGIPVLYLDQADVSEEYIYFATSGDQDMILEKLSVTGTPTRGWDESLDAFYFSHNLATQAGRICNTTRVTASPYAVLATDEVIVVDTDGGAITVNLPAGVDGTHYKIVNVGSAGNAVTVDPNGTEQLYGGGAGVAFTLYDGENIDIHYESTEGWW